MPQARAEMDASALLPWLRTRWAQTMVLLVALALVPLLGATANSDEFILKSGGRVEGELVNREESPRKTYVVRDTNGHTITLAADQVREARIKSDAERNYERILPRMPNTAKGNWIMAEWCGKDEHQQKLREQELFHLEEVIRLEPNHESARRRLGYNLLNGRWIKPDEFRREQGYEPFGGRDRVQQDIESIQQREEQELAEKQWTRNLLGIRNRARKSRNIDSAREELFAVKDANAIPALVKMLADESGQSLKALWIETLSRFQGSAVTLALVQCAIGDDDEEIRLQCLEELERRGDTAATDALIRELRVTNNDNRRINWAAAGLQRMQDPYAIPYLIEALTSKHVRSTRGNPGQISAAFPTRGRGSGGMGGLGVGSTPRRVEVIVENRSVLEALVSLSGGPNFQYDRDRWRQWYINANTPTGVNLRRGE